MNDWRIIEGDCRDVLAGLEPDSFDSMVTDPPAGISFMGKEWDHDHGGRDGWVRAFASAFREAYRVLKPGAHALVWAIPRTSHWTATALEDAGFEIRDVVTHHFGSGFPKSLDVSKAIDRQRDNGAGEIYRVTAWMRQRCEDVGIGAKELNEATSSYMASHWLSDKSQPAIPTAEQWAKLEPLLGEPPDWMRSLILPANRPGDAWFERPEHDYEGRPGMAESWTDGKGWNQSEARGGDGILPAAREWQGWGTALKPASEHWILCRKPLSEKNVAANVLRWGTGAINIDGCRVALKLSDKKGEGGRLDPNKDYGTYGGESGIYGKRPNRALDNSTPGRWPANLVLSHVAGCKRIGTKRVGSGERKARTSPANRKDTYSGFDMCDGSVNAPNEYGLETVEAWDCCPEWSGVVPFYFLNGRTVSLFDDASNLADSLTLLRDAVQSDSTDGKVPAPGVFGSCHNADRPEAVLRAVADELGVKELPDFRVDCQPCRRFYGGLVRDLLGVCQAGFPPLSDALESVCHQLSEHERSLENLSSGPLSNSGGPPPASPRGRRRQSKIVAERYGDGRSDRKPHNRPARSAKISSSTAASNTAETDRHGMSCRTSDRIAAFRLLSAVVFELASHVLPASILNYQKSTIRLQGCPVRMLDKQSGDVRSAGLYPSDGGKPSTVTWANRGQGELYDDSGGASRFYYCAKPSTAERNMGGVDNRHPTVKSIELMQYFCRMVTPKGGKVLDPFAGSGSTIIAALREGFDAVGIEKSAEDCKVGRRRIEADCPLFNAVY